MKHVSQTGRTPSSYYAAQPWRSRSSSRSGMMRWLIWTPLVIGGVVAAVAASRKQAVRDWLRQFFEDWEPSAQRLRQQVFGPQRDPALAPVREAIVGNTKQTIVSAFGPPPTAVAAPGAVASTPPPTFWQADVWYYPLDDQEQSAMAVYFRGGVARDVEFIYPPLQTGRTINA